jgi:hypothetical protein
MSCLCSHRPITVHVQRGKDVRILDPATEASADPLSEQILHRILSRQRTRMIADLLFCISTHPVRSYLALGGPAALHGVYLKGRAIEALDFVGRPGIALRLPELLRQTPFVFKALPEHGFFLVSRPDSARFRNLVRRRYAVRSGGVRVLRGDGSSDSRTNAFFACTAFD